MPYQIIIADDHQLVLEGISSMINEMPEFEIVATANDGKDALNKLSQLKADIILMDIEMPRMNGLEAGRVIKKEFPATKLLFLSMYVERSLIKKAIDLGADGYVLKNADKDEFILGLKKVMEGKRYFCSEISEILADNQIKSSTIQASSTNSEMISTLTERERDVLKLVAEGLSNKEIGEKLFISHRTVDTHRTNLMKKLNFHSVAELIRFAYQSGMVSH